MIRALVTGKKVFLAVALAIGLSACGINNVPTYDEEVKAAWRMRSARFSRSSMERKALDLATPSKCPPSMAWIIGRNREAEGER